MITTVDGTWNVKKIREGSLINYSTEWKSDKKNWWKKRRAG